MSHDVSLLMSIYKAYAPAMFESLLCTAHHCTEESAEKIRKAFDELSQSGQNVYKNVRIEEKCTSPSQLADESKWQDNQKVLIVSLPTRKVP